MKAITIALLLVGITAHSQFKIGNISVPDSMGTKFLKWCYAHPDTVEMRDSYSYLCANCTVSNEQVLEATAKAIEYNSTIQRESIRCIDVAGASSEVGTLYRYATPKKPTEILFIKWLTEHRK